ncbi:hypothetical protein TNCV_3100161 [Trichonephila clavipes]|nr:hypothetical protein TNCV_3100161 [Trichonephila clavipes]
MGQRARNRNPRLHFRYGSPHGKHAGQTQKPVYSGTWPPIHPKVSPWVKKGDRRRKITRVPRERETHTHLKGEADGLLHLGSRLANSIFVNALNLPNLKITFWSDSTTALWWIRKREFVRFFVKIGVKEIRQLTRGHLWGSMYPEILTLQTYYRVKFVLLGKCVSLGGGEGLLWLQP